MNVGGGRQQQTQRWHLVKGRTASISSAAWARHVGDVGRRAGEMLG